MKQRRIDSSESVIVGLNKYKDDTASHNEFKNVRQIDCKAVREKQVSQLQEIKRKRDGTSVQMALKKLEHSAKLEGSCTSHGQDPNNLLRLAIEAARVRCTLGEISQALENAWGRHSPTSTVVQGLYGVSSGTNPRFQEECKLVIDKVKSFELHEGRRPRILIAKMGQDGHDRGAKVIASGFSDLGFDVDIGPLFQTPHEVALQAIDSDVHVIGISSQAAGHKALLPALKHELEKLNADHVVVVVGGVIPFVDYDYLVNQTKSCKAIFGPGTRITDAAMKVLDLIKTGETEG